MARSVVEKQSRYAVNYNLTYSIFVLYKSMCEAAEKYQKYNSISADRLQKLNQFRRRNKTKYSKMKSLIVIFALTCVALSAPQFGHVPYQMPFYGASGAHGFGQVFEH